MRECIFKNLLVVCLNRSFLVYGELKASVGWLIFFNIIFGVKVTVFVLEVFVRKFFLKNNFVNIFEFKFFDVNVKVSLYKE